MNTLPKADQRVTLRAVRPEDEAFLYKVYASTRADEIALVNWSSEQKESFLLMQFNAQRQYYLDQYQTAEYSIIQCDGVDIGRLIVDHPADLILLMDIALLPDHRNKGIGTALIQEMMAQAAKAGKPIHLHVEFFNPALHLYERLGFKKIQEFGVHYEMEWRPEVLESNG